MQGKRVLLGVTGGIAAYKSPDLVRRLRDLKPDVVHTHSSKAGIIGRWAARAARVPAIVHTIHGLAFTASTSNAVNSVYKFLEWMTAPITDRIVCVADAMRDQSLEAGIGSPGQYVTVYSGMHVEPFVSPPRSRCEVRRELGIPDEHVVVGTIASIMKRWPKASLDRRCQSSRRRENCARPKDRAAALPSAPRAPRWLATRSRSSISARSQVARSGISQRQADSSAMQ